MDVRKKVAEGSKAEPLNAWDPRSVLEMNRQAFQSWVRGISAVSENVNQFVQARWDKDVEIWSRLAASSDPRQWLEFHRNYIEKSASDYLAESGELARIAVDMARNSLAVLRLASGEQSRALDIAAD